MRGVEQAGLQSTIAFVLKHYPENTQNLLTQVEKECTNDKCDLYYLMKGSNSKLSS